LKTWIALAAQPALMVVVLVAVGLGLRMLGLEHAIDHAGERGPWAFLGIGALVCAAGVPRQIVAYAGGLAFGFWPGLLLAMVAEIIGCAIDFWWARVLARRWVARFLERSAARGGRVARVERFLAANAFSATLTMRLLPFGSNLAFNLLAGVSSVAALPFLLASVLGYVPQTVVFTLLGGGVRVSQGQQVGLAAVLMAASIGLGVVLMRRRPLPA
jgi:uncharacterized membrane protein YdjX (TVP38/TMEM64 family)